MIKLNNFFLGDIHRYIRVYESYLGKKIYGLFLFSFLASISEGLGFLMILPLLQSASVTSLNEIITPDENGLVTYLGLVLEYLNLDLNIKNILLLMGVLFSFKGIFIFTSLSANAYFRGVLVTQLKLQLYNAYKDVKYSYVRDKNTGHFMNVINEQCNRALLGFYHLNILVANTFNFIIFVLFAGMVALNFGIIAILFGIVLLTIFRSLASYVRILSRKTTDENGRLSQYLVQFIQSFKYLISTDQTSLFEYKIRQSIENLAAYQVKSGILGSFTHSVREPIAVLGIIAIIFFQVGYLEKSLTVIIVAILLFYKSMNYALAIQNSLQNTFEYIGAIEYVNKEHVTALQHKEITLRKKADRLSDCISLQNVCYKHSVEDRFVIYNCTLNIKVNEITAIVGASGSGKSTIASLICGVGTPESGSISFDSLDYKSSDIKNIRRKIGYVSQDSNIFDGTVIENITLDFDSPPTREIQSKALSAAKLAGLDEFICQLSDGFNTFVGDRGLKLSGGQRQRLFIARELFKSPEILILDEATSALDVQTENIIQESINNLSGSLTILIIAHRLSTIRAADMIYVIENGTAIESGTYDKLANCKTSKFHHLINLQTR